MIGFEQVRKNTAFATAVLCLSAGAVHAERPGVAVPAHDNNYMLGASGSKKQHHEGGLASGPGLAAAASHVVGLQCPNGGWNWEHGGCAATYANITAPICEGLLQAHAITGNAAYLTAAINGGNHDLADTFTGGGTWFGAFGPAFFHRLSQVSGNPAFSNNAASDFFDELTAGTYGNPADSAGYPVNTAGWITRLENNRSGGLINLRCWDLHQLPWVAGQIGNPGQQDLFRDAILSNLNNLNSNDPGFDPNYFGELIGVAGAVRGLALNGTTSFPLPIVATEYPDINGIDTLCELADHLAFRQNANGSWYWTMNGTGSSDEDTQTTAYAVLALMAAEQHGCGPYTTEIQQGREWLRTMQEPDGGFQSYPGGDQNIEVESEALWALGIAQTLSLEIASVCPTASPITVEVWARDLNDSISGYQAFIQFDSTKLAYNAAGSSYAAAPFDTHIQSMATANVSPGEIRIDGNVGIMDPPYSSGVDVLVATLSFNVVQQCSDTSVDFDLDEGFNSEFSLDGVVVATSLSNTDSFHADLIAPFISCPSNVVVNADAGLCSAVVDLYNVQEETFDVNPTLSATQAPGVWYTDRYAPFGFVSASFDGGLRLRHSIDASDGANNRPPAFNSAFYNTQGRKFDIPGTTSMSIDLYVPSDWEFTGRRMAGLWGTGFNSSAAISAYPILEFTSDGGTPRFQAWPADPILGGFFTLGLPTGFSYDTWHTLTISLSRNQVTFTVGDLSSTVDSNGSVMLGNVILQGHNTTTGVSYDIHWDNFTYQEGAIAFDSCSTPVITAVRDDGLALTDPYPAVGPNGPETVITWTATDACGNSSSCDQTVTVNPVNDVNVAIQLVGSDLSENPTRCFHFVLDDCDITLNAELDVVGDMAIGTIEVPCGVWASLCVKDEQHTLWDTALLTDAGSQYNASSVALPSGDTDNDGDVDIHDLTWLLFTFADPAAAGDCPWDGTRDADFSNNTVVGAEDYSILSGNWLSLTGCGCSDVAIDPDSKLIAIETRKLHPQIAARVDRNRDGVFNHKDVKMFEREHGLPDTLSRKMTPGFSAGN